MDTTQPFYVRARKHDVVWVLFVQMLQHSMGRNFQLGVVEKAIETVRKRIVRTGGQGTNVDLPWLMQVFKAELVIDADIVEFNKAFPENAPLNRPEAPF